MRRAISIVLAATLVLTPIKMVVAQARQQASQMAGTDSTAADQTPTRIGVPVVEPSSGAALLFTVGMRADTLARDALPLPYRGVSTKGKVALVVVGLLVALVVFVVTVCSGGVCSGGR